MKNALIILFIILWFSNFYIASWMHPEYLTNHSVWDARVIDREIIFEYMFFILLFLGIFKASKLSKSLTVFASVLVASSLIDKHIHLQTTYTYYDPVVILFGIFLATFIYRHGGN